MSENKRQFERIDLSKLAFAKDGEHAHGGLLKDISKGGAFIEFHYPLGRVEHDFQQGDSIELLLQDETLLTGTAVRILDGGIALEFNVENDAQEAVIDALIAAEA